MQYFLVTTQLPPYIPYARFLLETPLNDTARVVYSLLLSRIYLSQSNGWVDGQGRVFCRYRIKDLMADTGKSKSTIVMALADLESQGLLDRQREGTWNANKFYLRVPVNDTSEVQKTTPQQCGKPNSNNKNKKLNYTYKGDSF